FWFKEPQEQQDFVDDYHGTKVSDPYAWLEDPDSPETTAFVEQQNQLTMPYLENCGVRARFQQRLTELYDYPKYSCPYKRGSRYFYFHNKGLQNQDVLYVQDSLDAAASVFFDPNTLSEDGTVALKMGRLSEECEYFAYGLSSSGSDWVTLRFLKADGLTELPDVLERVKFSCLAWTHDARGVFYNCYPRQEGKADGQQNLQGLSVGAIPGRYQTSVCRRHTGSVPNVRLSAPYRLGTRRPMSGFVSCVHQRHLLVNYVHDVKDVLQLFHLPSGRRLRDLPLDVGTIAGVSCKKKHSEFFYKFCSFTTPGIIYHCDLSHSSPEPRVFREVEVKGINQEDFQTSQVFYPSKDGTRIPMFLVHAKNLKKDGTNPVFLYGYGGFEASIQPYYNVAYLLFVRHLGGILAVANIRGGGEYGLTWHKAGTLENKQNCFDDFQSAAEFLIQERYTTASRVAINGGSNGGLLVAACMIQRPELFGCVVAEVGVLDMLRFHKFTIGHAWTTDYGCSDDPAQFHWLIKYSPLHNLPEPPYRGPPYPAVLLLTADHDDRVVPLHTLKFCAALQHGVGSSPQQRQPLMVRVDTRSGHGAGKPTAKAILEDTHVFAFIAQTLGLSWAD
uniref:Prolyl endopeptidase n=1 Tax=Fundulus heteroclitus TaxID=8078 RepID=A0A3Q2PXM5_FUNHE